MSRTPTGYKYLYNSNNYEIFKRKACEERKENSKVTCNNLFPPYLKYSLGEKKYFEAQTVADEPTDLSIQLSNMILDTNGNLKEEHLLMVVINVKLVGIGIDNVV